MLFDDGVVRYLELSIRHSMLLELIHQPSRSDSGDGGLAETQTILCHLREKCGTELVPDLERDMIKISGSEQAVATTRDKVVKSENVLQLRLALAIDLFEN